ncbi:MAG: polysaccharide biosynthesis tyrosine autokinase [Pirellulales bacterium]|nr:polysaccharide biosynthesis tyrosine autokinase [Pirellulales bacterium]
MSDKALIPSDGQEQQNHIRPGYGYGYPAAMDVEVTGSGAGFSLSFVTAALRRWWKLCLPVGLILAVGASVAIWFLKKPEYQSDAWLQIHSAKPFLAFEGSSLEDRLSMARFRGTQAQLIQSPVILHPVVNKLDASELDVMPPAIDQQIEWLRERVVVASPGESEFFKVSFTANDPEMARNVVELIVKEYLRYRREVDRKERETDLLQRLDEEQANHEEAKELIQKEIQKLFAQVYPSLDPGIFDEQGSGMVQANPLAVLEAKRLDTLMDKAIMNRELRELQLGVDELPAEPPEELVDAAVDADEEILVKVAEVDEAKRLYDDAFAKAPNLPVVEQLKDEWVDKQDELDRLRSEVRPEIQENMRNEMAGQLKSKRIQRVADIEASLRNFDEYEKVLKGQIDKKKEELKALGATRLELQEAIRRRDIEDSALTRLSVRRTELQTERGAPEQVNLKAAPLLPTASVSTAWPYIFLASLVCLCLPFGVTMAWEFWTKRVSNSRDIKHSSMINVIGEITQFPTRRLDVDAELDGTPIYEESIDQVCATLMYSPQTEDMRIFAVCSAVSGEGKTSVAAQLAMSLARACSERVLLIDGDLRDPDIANLFHIDESPGLSEVLSSRCSPREAIFADWQPKLHLLAAGYLSDRPQAIFGQGRFQAVLKELAAGYDYVVIDTPPILCASEALAIAKAADGVLVCSMRDKSRTSQVAAAVSRVRDAGGTPVGCVLSGIPRRDYLNHYGTYAKAYAVDSQQLPDEDDWDHPGHTTSGESA